jgi:radical SAM-linked protein
VIRLRVRYAQHDKVRFLSSRDMARVAERAVRRAGLPVAYSEGFSPRPRLHFGLALSTGYESEAEYLDLDLDPERPGPRDPEAVAEALEPCLPRGVQITAIGEIGAGEPSLQDAVTSTAWWAEVREDPGSLSARAERLLRSDRHEIEIVRKGKQLREDLRPLLLDLRVRPVEARSPRGAAEPIAPHAELRFELGTKPRSIRPAELMATLGVAEPVRVRRTHQWIQRGNQRFEPLGLPEVPPHAQARAS